MENIPNQEKEPTKEELLDMFNEAVKRSEIENESAETFLLEEFKRGTIDVEYTLKEAKRTGYYSILRNLTDIYKERGFSTKNFPE